MKIGTKVVLLIGMWKDHKATVRPKRGHNCNANEIVVNIYQGPTIKIGKSLVKKDK